MQRRSRLGRCRADAGGRSIHRAALLLSVLCACHPTINFDLTQSGSGKITGSPVPVPPGTLSFALPSLQNVNASNLQGFPSGQTAKDHIQSARAKKITFRVTDPPSGQNLSFVSSLSLTISAAGLPDQQFAHLAPFPAAQSADLTLDDVDLAPYLKADSFSISTTASGTPPPQNTTVGVDLVLGIEASVF